MNGKIWKKVGPLYFLLSRKVFIFIFRYFYIVAEEIWLKRLAKLRRWIAILTIHNKLTKNGNFWNFSVQTSYGAITEKFVCLTFKMAAITRERSMEKCSIEAYKRVYDRLFWHKYVLKKLLKVAAIVNFNWKTFYRSL